MSSKSLKFDVGSLEAMQTASAFTFSAQPLNQLGASEYTLVVMAIDESSSVSGFVTELEKTCQTVVEACQKSPRVNNLMLRTTTFNHHLREVHGFKLLGSINAHDYKGSIKPNGSTALVDSTYEAIESVEAYAKQLSDQGCTVNAIVFVGTDGEDISSKYSPAEITKVLNRVRKSEVLESITVVLIGITNGSSGTSAYLDDFKTKAGITQYVDVGSMTPQKIAKLADFVSKSISSTSQALGSKGPSQPLTF